MKLPRDVTGPEAVKALRRIGFVVNRQDGSHIRMSRGPLNVMVPNHNPVLPQTLQSILRQAQVSLEEFVENL